MNLNAAAAPAAQAKKPDAPAPVPDEALKREYIEILREAIMTKTGRTLGNEKRRI